MKEELKYTILSSLLEFYSDRAIAHASFLVACIFGLFTILSVMNNVFGKFSLLVWILLAITYWVLWSFGLYSLLNFGFFATVAQVSKEMITEGSDLEKDVMEKAKKMKRGIFRVFFNYKESEEALKKESSLHKSQKVKILTPILYFLRKRKTTIFIGFYFLFIGFIPFVASLINILS